MHLVHLSCLPIGLDMTQFALSWTLFTQLALPWALLFQFIWLCTSLTQLGKKHSWSTCFVIELVNIDCYNIELFDTTCLTIGLDVWPIMLYHGYGWLRFLCHSLGRLWFIGFNCVWLSLPSHGLGPVYFSMNLIDPVYFVIGLVDPICLHLKQLTHFAWVWT